MTNCYQLLKQDNNYRVKALFIEFSAIYGVKWSSTIATPETLLISKENWIKTVSAISDRQFSVALAKSKILLKFPPTIFEFLCFAYDFLSDIDAFVMMTKYNEQKRDLEYLHTTRELPQDIYDKVNSQEPKFIVLKNTINSFYSVHGSHGNEIIVFNKTYENEIKKFILNNHLDVFIGEAQND